MSGKADELISRQDAIEYFIALWECIDKIMDKEEWEDVCKTTANEMPSAESVKAYTKADYIIALHKEYGCTIMMAEEAHNKALEYLRSKARMKG